MTSKHKLTRVSARLPADLMARVDFVVRNSDPEIVKNRSAALSMALAIWLPNEETRLVNLGIIPKKVR